MNDQLQLFPPGRRLSQAEVERELVLALECLARPRARPFVGESIDLVAWIERKSSERRTPCLDRL